MHQALTMLYGEQNHTTLAGGKTAGNALSALADYIFSQKEYNPDILAGDEGRALITDTANTLCSALDGITEETPAELTEYLRQNIFTFSGFKTHRQLQEINALLITEDGTPHTYNNFQKEVLKIDDTYNTRYLQAEYNYAVGAANSAARWSQITADGDHYDLQYRTVGDEHVRTSHRPLDNITLPPSHPFWQEYFPPNGWNCRCTAVQVRRGKYPQTDSHTASRLGALATPRPADKIFRYNPGEDGKIFPPKHPYLPKGCGNCPDKTGNTNLVFDDSKAICRACRAIDKTSVSWSRDRVRDHYKKALQGKEAVWEINNGAIDKLTVSYQDIKNMTGKAHEYPYARNMSVYYLKTLLKQGKYIGFSPDIKTEKAKGHGSIVTWYYYEIPFMGQKSYLEVKEYSDGVKSPHHIQDNKHFDINKIKNKVK